MKAKIPMIGQKRLKNRGKPRISPDPPHGTEWFSVESVRGWCEEALGKKIPSDAACKQLARDFQVAVNRINNLERRKIGQNADYKDVDPNELFREKITPLLDAANMFIVAAQSLEKFAGNYVFWEGTEGSTTLLDAVEIMRRVVALQQSDVRQVSKKATSGRPPEAWHTAARAFSPLIRAALRTAGHTRNLSATNENSPVAIIGAQAVNHAYQIKIESAAFATAMRDRNRRQGDKAEKEMDSKLGFDDLFPEVRP